ncbi:MAG: metalloregulator ArsR/SmtB family transcription factor [Firmicutes bacterium]|nr:metalloregulator ArsR/SmtB family transcription factor [Bacillota bacterium]
MQKGKIIDSYCTVIHQDVVNNVSAKMLEEENFYELSNFFKLFADNTRLKILWALSCEDMCVCDIAALLNMTKSAVSHQLKLLRLANVVKFSKQGKVVYYSLVDCHIKDIFDKGLEHTLE